MTTYSVGSFNFISLSGVDTPNGAPETVRQVAAPIQRPGVAGTGFIQLGIKATRPFRMRSFVDVADVSTAQTLIKSYENAINVELLKIVHANTDYSATPVFNQYWPMDVQAGWRRVAAAVGGLAGGVIVVEAFWTFLPVYLETTP